MSDNSKMNWYKPHTFISQLEDPINSYYLSILMRVPKKFKVELVKAELSESTDPLFDVHIGVMHHDRSNGHHNGEIESKIWSKEIFICDLSEDVEIRVLVFDLLNPRDSDLIYNHSIKSIELECFSAEHGNVFKREPIVTQQLYANPIPSRSVIPIVRGPKTKGKSSEKANIKIMPPSKGGGKRGINNP